MRLTAKILTFILLFTSFAMEKRFYLKSELAQMLMPKSLQDPTRALFRRIHQNTSLMQELEKSGYCKDCKLIAAEAANKIISAFSEERA